MKHDLHELNHMKMGNELNASVTSCNIAARCCVKKTKKSELHGLGMGVVE
jgi:hypothetical protein